MSERRREGIDWFVEITAKEKVGERGVNGLYVG
jgi:hypothetical protein